MGIQTEDRLTQLVQRKNKLAITSFAFSLSPILTLVLFYFFPSSSLVAFIVLISFYISPAIAVICGIIALLRKENKFFSISGVILGILAITIFYILGFGIHSVY